MRPFHRFRATLTGKNEPILARPPDPVRPSAGPNEPGLLVLAQPGLVQPPGRRETGLARTDGLVRTDGPNFRARSELNKKPGPELQRFWPENRGRTDGATGRSDT